MARKTLLRVRIGVMLVVAGAAAAAFVLLNGGLRHGDVSAVNVLLSIVNFALLSNVWVNQRKMSDGVRARLSAQADSAARLEALCEVLQADYAHRQGSRPAPGDAQPAHDRILH